MGSPRRSARGGLLDHAQPPEPLSDEQCRALAILQTAAEHIRHSGNTPSNTMLSRLAGFAEARGTRRKPAEHWKAMHALAAAHDAEHPLSKPGSTARQTAFELAAKRLRARGVSGYPAEYIYGIWNSKWGADAFKQCRDTLQRLDKRRS